MFDTLKEKLTAGTEKLVNINWSNCIKSFFEKCRWFNIQLTTAFGITTTIHWSVPAFLLFLLFCVDPLQAGIATIAFLSVVPHEYGHALAARYFGIKTKGIVLYPLGGIAMLVPNKNVKLERWRELIVAAAGPAVTFVLAVIGAIMMFAQPMPDPHNFTLKDLSIWFWLFASNTIMFIFNMIPAFPMDGGRMLRATINLFTSHVRSTQYAYYCSLVFCILIGILGVWRGSIMLPFTMALVHFMARLEYAHVRRQAALEAAKAAKEANETPLEVVEVIEPEKKSEKE